MFLALDGRITFGHEVQNHTTPGYYAKEYDLMSTGADANATLTRDGMDNQQGEEVKSSPPDSIMYGARIGTYGKVARF